MVCRLTDRVREVLVLIAFPFTARSGQALLGKSNSQRATMSLMLLK